MINTTSKSFRAFFLLNFTKELIRAYGAENFIELKTFVKKEPIQEKKELQKIVKQQIRINFNTNNKINPLQRPIFKPLPQSPMRIPQQRRILRIPEPRLPPRLQYLQPIPSNIELDLGKLTSFVKDPIIKTIGCNGPGEKITITTPIQKTTEVILSKEEIDEIINKFSSASRIPATEGIFRVAVGKLIISAIISEVIGSKFIIKKIMYTPIYPQRPNPTTSF